jgi:GH35 family endo-1,4-beta-xylanase
MFRRPRSATLAALSILLLAATSRAQPPSQWPIHSSGSADDTGAWTLTESGYVGTYFKLAAPGTVTISVTATPARAGTPSVNVAVAGTRHPARDQPIQLTLPAGTFFCRVELTNGVPMRLADITLTGADLLPGNRDEDALAAADTFISTGRRSAVSVELRGLAPGTVVHIKQTQSAFHFGANASGNGHSQLLTPNSPPDSDPARFQATFPTLFNTIVPSNAGKWAYCEATPGVLTMAYPDAILAFAREHGLFARMHNLIWDTGQQPKWVIELLDRAEAGDADAKKELRAAISRRIQYYVRDRCAGFGELDVLNESVHRGRYLKVFGIDGIAGIYAECADAIRAAGVTTLTCVNEYNVIQYSQAPTGAKGLRNDPFANWYRSHIESLQSAGAHIGTIGVQYYADPRPNVADPHRPAHVREVIESLAVTGLPVSLTEFGIKKGGAPEQSKKVLEESLRIAYGSPDVSGFLFFGFWEKAMWDQAPAAMLVDAEFHLTPLGEAYVALRKQWTTETNATVGEDHRIHFTGFHGTYTLTSSPEVRHVTLLPGVTEYQVPTP